MFNRIRDGLEEGRRRYGTRDNASMGTVCQACGHAYKDHTDDNDCSFESCDCKAFKERQNDRPMGDYAKCSCGHEKALHDYGKSACWTCGCAKFQDSVSNELANRDPGDVCQGCGETWEHHDLNGQCQETGCKKFVERGMENANEKCSRCGAGIGPEGALGIEHGHDKYCVDCAVAKGFIDEKDVPNSRKNDTDSLGYQQETTTTVDQPGKSCSHCGHIIGQIFADGICACGCHQSRKNSIECPACQKPIDGGISAVKSHLESYHDMSEDEAEAALGARINAEDTFICDECGDTERDGLKTVAGDKWLCEECAEKK